MKTPCKLAALLFAVILLGCATPKKDPDAPKHKWQDDHGVLKSPSHLRFR